MSRRRFPSLSMLVIVVVAIATGCTALSGGNRKPNPTPVPAATPTPNGSPTPSRVPIGTPEATPLASPPAAPAGDGTKVTLSTTLGDIVIEIYNLSSPVAATNFVNLAESGFYNDVIFHRVISGFVIQAGDPDGTGQGGPGYTIKDDVVVGDYTRGIVAMARPSASDGSKLPDSAGSQFFICLADLRDRLDKAGGYAVFGNVTSGMDIVDAIAAQPTDPSNDRPLDPVGITSATVTRP